MGRLTPRNFKYHDLDFMDSGLAEAMNKLAHYEDMEEQGRLIEQKHGTWRPVAFDSVCSSCRYSETTPLMIMRRDFRYCPSCGAKMVSEAKLKELKGEHFADVDKMGKE